MKVKSLAIERRPSYDSEAPNQFVGLIQLSDDNGAQTIRLSNAAINKIFTLLIREVSDMARKNAANTQFGLEQAANDLLLTEVIEA